METGIQLDEAPQPDAVDGVVFFAAKCLATVLDDEGMVDLAVIHKIFRRADVLIDEAVSFIEQAGDACVLEACDIGVSGDVDGHVVEGRLLGRLTQPLLLRS